MKITKIMLMLLVVISLASCDQDEVVMEDITLELIGEETVRIEEGEVYEDLGVLVNGEQMDLGYYSSVNTDKIGTYYIKYEYYGEEILRTVEVIPGAKTQLLLLVEDLNSSTNFSYTLNLDVIFTRGGVEFHTFAYEDYDVYGDYLYGTLNKTSFQMTEYTQNAYIYIDKAYKIEELYLFDEHGMWYHEYNYYPKLTTSITDFQLDGLKSVTKEVIDGQTVYTAYLNFEDYIYAYNTKINLIPNEAFDFQVDDYIKLIITEEDGHIVKIETDLTDIMKQGITEASLAVPTRYHYLYTFSNFDEIEPITIPDEGIQAKRLVYLDYSGTGTIEDPYIIMDKIDFMTIGDNLELHYKLGADIDLSSIGWMPFGLTQWYLGQSYCFTGSIDGDGYAINNLTYGGEYNYEDYGLFMCINGTDGGGIVKNLTFNNVDISLYNSDISFTGGVLAAEIVQGTITNVSINGRVKIKIVISDGAYLIYLGGLTGKLSSGSILTGNSYNLELILETNLTSTNYVIHEVVALGQEFLTTYESTSTTTVITVD